MIRIRSQKLLSGVSTLAVMTAFGVLAEPALAGQNINAGPNPPVEIGAATNTSFVNINPGAIVAANGSGNSFTNLGSIFGASTALWISQATLSGGVSNSSVMFGNNYGIHVENNSLIQGNIANSGSIDGGISGILIDSSVVNGSITNSLTGTITGDTAGIDIGGNAVVIGSITNAGVITGLSNTNANGIRIRDNAVVTGGITNSGNIGGGFANTGNGISLLGNATLSGGLSNTGTIAGGFASNANGILINTASALVGDINNSGVITSFIATSAAGINLQSGVITGSIINSGTISAESAANGATAIKLAGGTLAGNIDNSGLILGSDVGVRIANTVAGKLLNQSSGSIVATTSNGAAVSIIGGGTLAQGIDNQGSIVANASSAVGISMFGGTLQNGITNSGVISATGTNGIGISMGLATVGGGISNSGTIQAGGTAIAIAFSTFSGGITNDGNITSNSATGIYIANSAAFDGGITNNGLIGARNAGIQVDTITDFNGNIDNSGTISSSGGTAILLTGITNFNGDLTNSGTIVATTPSGVDGVNIDVANFDGSITNDGLISADDTSIFISAATTITGDLTNTGTILGGFSGGQHGVSALGAINGALNNSGVISAVSSGTGLRVAGPIAGGITNSGTISSGSGTAINIAGAPSTTITQTAGLISGPTALNMLNGADDDFEAKGGVVEGDVLADGFDDFSLSGAGTFAYASGTATGVFHLDVDGTGTFLLGSDTRGVDGAGVNVTADHTNFSQAGRLYLDDNTLVTLGGGFFGTVGGATEFFLTTNTAQHGAINAANINLNGTIEAYIDPVTFGTNPLALATTLTYDNVLTGARAGTFSNGTTLVTSSPFFVGTVVYNANDVDITINRLALSSALVTDTQNQAAVGGALETIYTAGGYSGTFTDLFTDLFAATTAAEAQALLDELSGSQHAQLLQTAQNLTGSFNDLVEERMDGILTTQDGVRMSGSVGQRYAQAVAVASDAAAPGLRGSQGLTRGPSGWSIWGRGVNHEVNAGGDGEAQGYDQGTQAAIVGADYALSESGTVGGSFAYGQTTVKFVDPLDRASLDTMQVNLFGSFGLGRFYFDGQASYGWHDINNSRMIDLGPTSGSARADAAYNASTWTVDGEFGSMWRLGRVNMQPSLRVAYTDSSSDSFTETGPSYALSVTGGDAQSLATTLALRASGQWMMAKTPVVPDLKIGWRHEFLDDRYGFSASFIEDPTVPMSIVSSQVQPDSLVVSTGATFGVTHNFEVFFDVNGLYNADASATNASGGVRVTW